MCQLSLVMSAGWRFRNEEEVREVGWEADCAVFCVFRSLFLVDCVCSIS